MVTLSLGPTLLEGDWSCQQPPCHCEHRHTECPEASSLRGLPKIIDTDVVSICLKPILCITRQRQSLWRQSPSQSFFPVFSCLVAPRACHKLQRMRLSQGSPYHPMATGDRWSSLTGQPHGACQPKAGSVSTKHLGVIKA